MHDFLQVYQEFHIFDVRAHPLFTIFAFAIVFDIVLGLAKGWATKTFKSSKARIGIVSHAALLVISLLVYPLFAMWGFQGIADTFLVFLGLSYFASIVGNLEALGVPIPPYLMEKLSEEIKSKDENVLSALDELSLLTEERKDSSDILSEDKSKEDKR